jgi:hypothetical protein
MVKQVKISSSCSRDDVPVLMALIPVVAIVTQVLALALCFLRETNSKRKKKKIQKKKR